MLFSAAVCSSSFPGTHFQNVNPPDIFLLLFSPPEIIIMILSLHYMSCGPLCCTGRSHTGSLNSAVWLVYKHVKAEKKKKKPKKPSLPTTATLSEKWEVILSWLHFTALLWKQTVHFICTAELEVLKITSCLPDNKSYYSTRKWAPFECSRSTHPVIGETAI